MRMTFWRELRWIIATQLVGWAFSSLTQHEASDDLIVAFDRLAKHIRHPDPKFDTVKKRKGQR